MLVVVVVVAATAGIRMKPGKGTNNRPGQGVGYRGLSAGRFACVCVCGCSSSMWSFGLERGSGKCIQNAFRVPPLAPSHHKMSMVECRALLACLLASDPWLGLVDRGAQLIPLGCPPPPPRMFTAPLCFPAMVCGAMRQYGFPPKALTMTLGASACARAPKSA